MKQFRDVEADLQGLDAEAWAFLKSEVAPLLRVRHPTRGWQFLFDKLNQAKSYNYLRGAGYPNVRFIPPSAVPGQQTPDLEADGVLCEVKTINALDAEANRRHSGGVGSVTDQLDEGFFRKLSSDLKKAKAQMVSYDGGVDSKHIVYIIANFDDSLHEYADRYQRQLHGDGLTRRNALRGHRGPGASRARSLPLAVEAAVFFWTESELGCTTQDVEAFTWRRIAHRCG